MEELTNTPNPEPTNMPGPEPTNTPDPEPGPDYQSLLEKERSKRLELEKQLNQRKESDLKQNQQWEELATAREKENADLKGQIEGLTNSIVSDKKLSALRTEALKHGIRNEALDDLDAFDFSEVSVIQENGQYKTLGAKKAIERLKTLRPFWFSDKALNVNSGNPRVDTSGNDVTFEKLMEAKKKAHETGHFDEYKKLNAQYNEQLKRKRA